ncbi:Uncharacterized protein TCM_044398 [Theobroma cacao]|uniref:Uncharacterized protein n=1 Tax=Theobroma cacao TaxID=3641 RepID=A0A061FQZ3_THECC|nr:Uncharacterized protein TCM_044398 [Theobroma cacao]
MRELMLSLTGFRSAFGVMSAYRDVAAVVTGSMGVSGRDMRSSNYSDVTPKKDLNQNRKRKREKTLKRPNS